MQIFKVVHTLHKLKMSDQNHVHAVSSPASSGNIYARVRAQMSDRQNENRQKEFKCV